MERGDLAVSVRQHYVVVLEGVLAMVTDITDERPRWRGGNRVTGHNLHWLDIPMRRLATMRRQYPDVGAEVVTFIDAQVADEAAIFLDAASVPVDSLSYEPFDRWVSLLPYQEGLQAVFDSNPLRLDRYGQIGRQVTMGKDFI
jgi:hypothetical protein